LNITDPEEIRIESDNLKGFVKKLLKKYPDIRPSKEDDWDWTWADDGYELLEAQDYLQAESKFEQLIVSQPDAFDGYEGLALTYQAQGRKSEAEILIDHAVKIATRSLKNDAIDREALDEMLAEQLEIHGT